MFVVKNRNFYQANNDIHHINTRQFGQLHVSSVRMSVIQRGAVRMSVIQRGVLYSSILVYNNLPQNIQKMSDNVKILKRTLKSFLIANAFYSIDEYTSAKHV
jgi:hypothetical protein